MMSPIESETTDLKQKQNIIGLDPRKSIFAPKARQVGGINHMNHARMTVK